MTLNLEIDSKYWNRRSDMMYYKYINFLVRALAFDANSLIDVGSANTQYIEEFDWIPNKFALDIKNPYHSPRVKAIETDFLEYLPEEKFDFVTCLQVLEHIPNVEAFAKKLLTLSDHVLISVPYMWPEDATDEHVHDPIDLEKLTGWIGKEPTYSIIVSEPLRIPSKGISKRLICYYQAEDNLDYKVALKNANRLTESKLENLIKDDLENLHHKIEKSSQQIEKSHQQNLDLEQSIKSLVEEQKEDNRKLKMELSASFAQERLDNKVQNNIHYSNRSMKLEHEIKQYDEKIRKARVDQRYFLKRAEGIRNSRAWRVTYPIRKLGDLFKKKKHT
ncbi:hypothetical protein CR203_05970 [Salipaludibacillus neizhouensis]|uniref:Uncharacterized protein n=1 Tax=Salipaludibacillus neizhouensis TaxID=885475 RepID=A0A3A9KBY8_9BACI|nr:methyltransferase domain-containing protein [Salipaludibacillus neizhouensis]RKL68042.1 hypothetical protein CR203_05970 [Salipaludibacillus neizhouensis]